MADTLQANVQESIMQSMAAEASGAGGTRLRRWDQLAADTASMWAGYLTTPTVLAGQGIRMLNGTPTMAPGNAPNANAG